MKIANTINNKNRFKTELTIVSLLHNHLLTLSQDKNSKKDIYSISTTPTLYLPPKQHISYKCYNYG